MSQAKNLIEFSEFVKLSEQNTGLAKKWKSVYDTLKSITDKVQKSYKAFPSSAIWPLILIMHLKLLKML